jgi:hypothetical protein
VFLVHLDRNGFVEVAVLFWLTFIPPFHLTIFFFGYFLLVSILQSIGKSVQFMAEMQGKWLLSLSLFTLCFHTIPCDPCGGCFAFLGMSAVGGS